MWGAFSWGEPLWGDAPDISSDQIVSMNLCDGRARSLMPRRTGQSLMPTRTSASLMPRRSVRHYCESED